MYELLIDGPPIALQRHRSSRGIMYDPQSSIKKKMLKDLAPILKRYPLLDEPISIHFIFDFAIPKQKSKRWRRENYYRQQRPDASNCLKFYEDLFNGILWKDDSQIVYLSAEKRYNDIPKTFIQWQPIPNEYPYQDVLDEAINL